MPVAQSRAGAAVHKLAALANFLTGARLDSPKNGLLGQSGKASILNLSTGTGSRIAADRSSMTAAPARPGAPVQATSGVTQLAQHGQPPRAASGSLPLPWRHCCRRAFCPVFCLCHLGSPLGPHRGRLGGCRLEVKVFSGQKGGAFRPGTSPTRPGPWPSVNTRSDTCRRAPGCLGPFLSGPPFGRHRGRLGGCRHKAKVFLATREAL